MQEQIIIRGKPFVVICADCVVGMQSIPEQSVDVVVTSPPYNIGTKYRCYDDKASRDAYLDWAHTWLKEIKRILSPAGSFFLNMGGTPSNPTGPFSMLQTAHQYFTLQNAIVWAKSVAITQKPIDMVFGHYQPINSPRFVNGCHEHIFHLTHKGDVHLDRLSLGVPYKDKGNIARWKSVSNAHCRGSVWYIPYETIQDHDRDRPHPAAFPRLLPEWCIRLHGVRKDPHVLDPFVGIGTTGLACASLGVAFTGIDIDPGYYQTTLERLKALAQNTAEQP